MVEPNEDNTAWRRALRREMVARRAALSDAEHARTRRGRLLLADQARAGRTGRRRALGGAGCAAGLAGRGGRGGAAGFSAVDSRYAARTRPLRHSDAGGRRFRATGGDLAAAQRL